MTNDHWRMRFAHLLIKMYGAHSAPTIICHLSFDICHWGEAL